MVEALNGKWRLVSTENMEQFMKAIVVSADWMEYARRNLTESAQEVPVQELQISAASSVTVTTRAGGQAFSKTYSMGQWIDDELLDHRKCQTKFEIQGNQLIEMQVGTGFEIMTEREIVNGQMLYTLISTPQGIRCFRKYDRI